MKKETKTLKQKIQEDCSLIEKFTKSWLENKTQKELGELYNLSKKQVNNLCSLLGLKRVQNHSETLSKRLEKNNELKNEIISYYLENKSLVNTSKKFHTDVKCLKKLLEKNNISQFYSGSTSKINLKEELKKNPKLKDDIINFYLNRKSITETCNVFNVGLKSLRKFFKENNIEIFHTSLTKRLKTNPQLVNDIITYFQQCLNVDKTAQHFNTCGKEIKNILQTNNIKTLKEIQIQMPKCIRMLEKDHNKLEEIIKFYTFPNSLKATARKFEIDRKYLKIIFKYYNVPLHNKETTLKLGALNSKKALMKKYGVPSTFLVDEIRQKAKETIITRYGKVRFPTNRKYKVNDQYFDSFPELCFYLYCIESKSNIIREPVCIPFKYNNKIYNYIPDFNVDGKLYEIKGDQFVSNDGKRQNPFDHTEDGFMEAKRKCAIKNNVIILYSKDYVFYENRFKEKGLSKEDYECSD